MDLRLATTVWVGALSMTDEGFSDKEALASADFVEASAPDASEIVETLADEANYMATGNACFDRSAAVQIDLPSGDTVYALIGLTCWNVKYLVEDSEREGPPNGYLTPDKLEQLAVVLNRVDPSLDISTVGE